jgi:hypothetical protein
MTPLETLQKAREHLSDPKNWNKDGNYFKDNDRSSGCCCALGALALCEVGPNPRWSAPHIHDARAALMSALRPGGRTVTSFNDAPSTTHADILALFDRAIASVEGEA